MSRRQLVRSVLSLSAVLLFTVSGFFYYQQVTHADFKSNNIIDDMIFDNPNTMNAAQIDSFLNSFPSSCISTGHGFSAPDPTGYSPSGGYTYGGNVSAGQVIYDAAQAYSLNPEVLITTLQKEQSLVSGGSGCSTLQYTGAVGYGCPDGGTAYSYSGVNLYSINGTAVTSVSGTCVNSAAKAGFSQQIIHAAWLLKFGEQRSEGNTGWAVIKGNWNNSDDPGSCYGGPMTQGYRKRCASDSSAVYYDGYTTIDGVSTHMDDGATAALYWYTPHFSGNQHFDTIFQTWFGPTTTPDAYFAVINVNPDNGLNMWYLLTSTGRYYIPSTDIYNAWGLNNYSFQTVSQSYFDSLPDGGNLGRVLKDQWSNYFFMDGGQLHYARNANYLSLWGLSTANVPQSTGLVYSTQGGTWIGRFMADPTTTGQIWLMDNGTKHLVPNNTSMLYQWGYTPDQLTTVTSTYFNGLSDGGQVSRIASAAGANFMLDSGRVLYFNDPNTANAYLGQSTVTLNNVFTLSFLPLEQARTFVTDANDNKWYMLEGGNRHYIPNAKLAFDWGYKSGQPMTVLSDDAITSFTDGGTLSYVVQTASPAQQWVLDGAKHLLPNANVANAWVPNGSTIPTYTTQSLAGLSQGANATSLIQPQGSGYVYTLDNGNKRFLPIPVVVNAWGSPATTQVTSMNSTLTDMVPETQPISVLVQNSGTYYLLMNGTAYPINPTYASSWGVGASTPAIANSTLARFTVSSSTLGAFIKVNGTYYIMNNLVAIPVSTYLDAYGINDSNSVSLPYNYFATAPDASYLIKSTDSSDTRMWLMVQGQKMLFSGFPMEANYGYVSHGVSVTALPPAVLSAIPDATGSPSLLIKRPDSGGVKMLSFGDALGFPDGRTLTNYVSATNPILTVSPSVYESFALVRSTSTIVRDDSNNFYSIESGQKRLIQNRSLLSTTYAGIPVTYLQGTTIVSIPDGTPIN